jgi:hypothetical protein
MGIEKILYELLLRVDINDHVVDAVRRAQIQPDFEQRFSANGNQAFRNRVGDGPQASAVAGREKKGLHLFAE